MESDRACPWGESPGSALQADRCFNSLSPLKLMENFQDLWEGLTGVWVQSTTHTHRNFIEHTDIRSVFQVPEE